MWHFYKWVPRYENVSIQNRTPSQKTYLYNFDPLKPHFYVVKLGLKGVYIIFLFMLKNIDCEYSLEPPWWGSSNEYRQSMFWAEIWKKNIRVFFLSENIQFFGGEIHNGMNT